MTIHFIPLCWLFDFRCSETATAPAEEHWTNRIIGQPSFGRVEVESILNTKELKSNITVECLAYNSVGKNRAIYLIKGGNILIASTNPRKTKCFNIKILCMDDAYLKVTKLLYCMF